MVFMRFSIFLFFFPLMEKETKKSRLQNKIQIYLYICKVRLGDFLEALPVLLSIYFDIYKFSFEATFNNKILQICHPHESGELINVFSKILSPVKIVQLTFLFTNVVKRSLAIS